VRRPRAALPDGGYQPPARLLVDGERCVVRFATEDGRASREFDFARLPVDRALQVAFARAFDQATGPSGTRKAMASADKTYQALRAFGHLLARLPAPPRRPEELRASHLDQYALQRRHHQSFNREFSALKGVLRAVDGLGERFVAKLVQPNPHRHRPRPLRSYSQTEFRRILAGARHDAHAAAVRIRANRQLLADWRAGRVDRDADPTGWELGLILDEIERTGNVPRYPRGPQHARWFIHRHGTVPQLMSRIHLMWEEAAAFLVLLIGLTGHNGGTLGDMPAVHHRPDGQAGGTASAIVELRKPRRGKHRSHLPTALVDLSDPGATVAGEPPGEVPARDELHTPFGIYRLLLELTEPARRLVGTDRLLVCWAPKGFSRGPGFRVGATPSMVPVWGRRRHLPADPNPQQPDTPPGLLSVTMARLRLSYLQHHQKAVAHTDRVLATEYLGRDPRQPGRLPARGRPSAGRAGRPRQGQRARGDAERGRPRRGAARPGGSGGPVRDHSRGAATAAGRRARHRLGRLRRPHQQPPCASGRAVPGLVPALPGLSLRPRHPRASARPDAGAGCAGGPPHRAGTAGMGPAVRPAARAAH